jgi:two-component system, LytTR family, sensor kinase
MTGVVHSTPPTTLEPPTRIAESTPAPRMKRLMGRQLQRALALLAVWTAFGVLRTAMRIAIVPGTVVTRGVLIHGMLTAWQWVPLGLAILALVDRFPWSDARVARIRATIAHSLAFAAVLFVEPLGFYGILALVGSRPVPYGALVIQRADTVLLMYLTTLGAGYAIAAYRQYVARQVETARLESQLADAQLYLLTMQLQPHFLFNTLHLVSELVHENVLAARRTLDNLGRLLRQSFDHAARREVTLRDELAFLEAYLDIQRSRFGDRLSTNIDASPALLEARVPHLLLQPLVENAIRHGIGAHAAAGRITVSASQLDHRLVLRVLDDGAGLTSKSRRDGVAGAGLGMTNTRLRLQRLYGEHYRFEVRPRADNGAAGAEAIVELPFDVARDASARIDGLAFLDSTDSRPDIELLDDDPSTWPSAVAPPADPAATPPSGIPTTIDSGETTLVTSEETPTARRRFRSAASWLGIWVVVALAWTEIEALGGFGSMRPPESWARSLLLNLLNVSVWATLTPLAIWLARRFRVRGGVVTRMLAIHVVAGVVVGLLHIFGLDAIARAVHAPEASPMTSPLGWGIWDFFAYFTIVAFTHMGDFAAWYRDRAVESARLRSEVSRARLQLLRLRLQPRLLLSSLDALSALAVADPERCDRMITRLGDLLRDMLARTSDHAASADEELEFADALRELQRAALVDAH